MKYFKSYQVMLGIALLSISYSNVCLATFKFVEAVKGKIYRGSTVYTDQDFDVLKAHKVKTILNLRVIGAKEEALRASKNGIEYYFQVPIIPLPSIIPFQPLKSTVEEALAILSNPKYQPVFVHCTFGHERTGLLVALYKVYFEKISYEEARKDMLSQGFHRWLTFGIYRYFLQYGNEVRTIVKKET